MQNAPFERQVPAATWSENENAEGAECVCKLAGIPGRRFVVTTISAQLIAIAAVAAVAKLNVVMKRGGVTIFRGFLLQPKVAAEGSTIDRFNVVTLLTLEVGEAALITCQPPAAGVQVSINMAGYLE